MRERERNREEDEETIIINSIRRNLCFPRERSITANISSNLSLVRSECEMRITVLSERKGDWKIRENEKKDQMRDKIKQRRLKRAWKNDERACPSESVEDFNWTNKKKKTETSHISCLTLVFPLKKNKFSLTYYNRIPLSLLHTYIRLTSSKSFDY